ncbi:type I restriction endonuclease subunit S [Celeribacter ethanolicus]|uniref:Type I restriction endonuclease subunit S n=1 Tax=Celeribacter ethanolicus TaxID=1758178 RepID=A0A291GB63_9RHOB|nr:restriction endonuclease subunit S [Celeribacter ethanolicus]ATG47639.1 type I restriction endonuclease subunit S [Celeribacter ethanolicus]
MSDRGFLEKLLNGASVAWKPLGDIAQYSKTRISSEDLDKTNYVGVDNLLQNRAGRVDSNYVPTSGNLTEFRAGDILIGNIRPYLRKIWLADRTGGTNGDVLVIHPTDDVVNPRYLYQVLTDEKFFEYNIQHSKGAKMPRGSKPQIIQYPVPIPCPEDPEKSLAIQAEIVRILDSFTELTAELTAELKARKQQYNHYRHQLLSFDDGDVEWKSLGEVFDIFAGGDAPKGSMSKVLTEDYTIPILSNGIGEKALYGWTNKAKVEKPSLTVSARGTIGWTSHREEPFFPIVRLIVLTPKTGINLRFAYHFMKTIENSYKVPEAGIPQLTKPMIEGTPFPIPCPGDPERSAKEQARIVNILDKFDTLTTSLSEGLPREIKLRQQQYEYYRDLLLSFPKPEEAA